MKYITESIVALGFFVEYNLAMSEMNEKRINIIEGLNPDSAEKMGYFWWKDVVYDIEAPKETMQDIYEIEKIGEYTFGECATPDGQVNSLIGVYKKASL